MENMQNNNTTSYSSGDNKKNVLVTVIAGIIVLVSLVWWIRQEQNPTPSQQVQVSPTPDTESTAINLGIDSIDVGDLNSEFDAMDKDLQGL